MANEVYVGKDLGGKPLSSPPSSFSSTSQGSGPTSWYTGDSSFGGPVAPALIFSGMSSLST